ncbi:divergent polysaccharide deacetylase family protein [Saccharospirillum sp.]|uniref:divergent polysaccharide deacetylase family protein n=1 Tax=Saccharospirillum sp. TaxID=2033801 RepID=UPI0034A04C69
MPRVNTMGRLALWSSLCAFFLLISGLASAADRNKVAVVVDDLGNQWQSGLAAIQVPFIKTIAIMPGLPYTIPLAESTVAVGKTVIVHVPMSNESDFPLGPLGLTRADGDQQLLANLSMGMDSVPHAEGLSNHMGSRLTRDAEAMGWVMAELLDRNWFYFDSVTVANSQGWRMAEQMGVPWKRRQVFLDHEPTPEFIEQQWQLALRIARQNGSVTVICHPYPETLAFFESLELTDYPDIDWVSIKDLLHQPKRLVPQWRPHSIPKGAYSRRQS